LKSLRGEDGFGFVMVGWILVGLLLGMCLGLESMMRRRVRSGLLGLRELNCLLRLLYEMFQRMDGLKVSGIILGQVLSSRCGVLRREISPSRMSI
jgi:hypothetical protein